MTMVLLFAVVFLLGPLVFWALARRAPSRGNVIGLWAVAAATVGLAFVVRVLGLWAYGVPPQLLMLVALWMSWIAVLALCVLAVRARVRSPLVVRWAGVVGAMATTLPWFGLYAALMMSE